MASWAPSPSLPTRPQRVLACIRCQQRKIRCDRRFPCANCTTSRAQCVPATVTPRSQRRRRFPERELLERLRKYEDLLRQNHIKFEPLHKDSTGEKVSPNTQDDDESEDEQAYISSPATTIKSEKVPAVYEAKNYLRALNSGLRDGEYDSDGSHDDYREAVVRKGWDQLFADNDHLLFGSPNTNVDLSTLHPEPVQIFRLWQIYLDNVNSLLRVTHTPTMQGRIIEAASNVRNISPVQEALMFSIYCMAIHSLVVDDCQAMFGSSRTDLLTRFQFGCQQALLNCGFLRSNDRECLTALYLYLVSVGHKIVPRSLSAMLGVAVRIAQRMGIDSEFSLTKCTPLEAELRRRLWWSLVLFDTRVGELADYQSTSSTTLTPTWDCKIPLNLSDFDLRPETKELPEVAGKPTEALFAVVRGELGEFVRNTTFYLDFTFPALKPIIKDIQGGPARDGNELVALEKMIEDKYFRFCDPENPLHFVTIWTSRAFFAKHHLLEHYSKYSSPSMSQTEAQRDNAISHALNMLQCDTQLMTSSLTKGFLWHIQLYFPFPAYLQIVKELRDRPISDKAEEAWAVMSDNYETRFDFLHKNDNPFFKIFAKLILQAWGAREKAFEQLEQHLAQPKFVTSIKEIVPQMEGQEEREKLNESLGMGIDDFLMSIPMGSSTYRLGNQPGYEEMNAVIPNQPTLNVDVNNLGWSAMNWSGMNEPAGQGPYNNMAGQSPFNPHMTHMNQLDPSSRFSDWLPGR